MKLSARRSLYEDIVDEIGTRIVSGLYIIGEPLPNEEDLGAEFDVSRTVIRDSIKVLTQKGLVRPRPRVGTIVLESINWNQLDADVLLWKFHSGQQLEVLGHATELRLFIEPDACAVMCERASDEEIQAVTNAFEEMERAVQGDDLNSFIAADKQFHAHIINACHNPLIAQINEVLQKFLSVSLDVTANIPNKAEESLVTHRAVIEALIARDGDRAYAAMKMVLDTTMSVLLEEFRKQEAK